MVSFRTALLALAGAMVVSADYYIRPETVPMAIREVWCSNERSTCPLICSQVEPGTTEINTCDPETLTYGCLCGNNMQPNVSEYSLTLPFHVCQEWGVQCVHDCPSGDNACMSECKEGHPCGAQHPSPANKTSKLPIAATTSDTVSTEPAVFTGLAGGDSAAATGANRAASAAAQGLRFGSAYGLVVLATGMFAGFALML